MPEGPFGNVEIVGPRRDKHIIIRGIHIGVFGKQNLINNINSKTELDLNERDVSHRNMYEFDENIASRTVIAIDLGEEVSATVIQNITEIMLGVNFTAVDVVVGDKELVIEELIRR